MKKQLVAEVIINLDLSLSKTAYTPHAYLLLQFKGMLEFRGPSL